MANLGYRILDSCYKHEKDFSLKDRLQISWKPFLGVKKGSIPKKHDLVIASYVLNELRDDVERHQVLNKLINSTKKYIVLVESGTPHGFNIIEQARSYILKVSKKYGTPFHVVAPCPHDGVCPLKGKKSWCHFSQHAKRTEEQRVAIKSLTGSSPRDNLQEKFSYVILARGSRMSHETPLLPSESSMMIQNMSNTIKESQSNGNVELGSSNLMPLPGRHQLDPSIWSRYNARVLRPPRKRKGHVMIDLCSVLDEYGADLGENEATIIRQTISKAKAKSFWGSDEVYRASRRVRWGDSWPAIFQAGIKNSVESPIMDDSNTEDEEDEELEQNIKEFFGDSATWVDEEDEFFKPFVP